RLYQQKKKEVLEKSFDSNHFKIKEEGTSPVLKTILGEVMPYFLEKKENHLDKAGTHPKRRLNQEEMINLIKENINLPSEYYKKAEGFYALKAVEKSIKRRLGHNQPSKKIPPGEWNIKDLEPYLQEALETKILNEEKLAIKDRVLEKKELIQKGLDYTAVLLYLQEKKSLEVGNFGLRKNGTGPWQAYVRVDEYALRDFDGRIYLFPPCQVGVNIYARKEYEDDEHNRVDKPQVLNKYKHPFLRESWKNQPICTGGDDLYPKKSLAETVVHYLERGIEALLYGYCGDEDDFNGYHQLSDSPDDYQHTYVPFSKYRISENHRKITSGKVIITNDPFIKIQSIKRKK
ncbi:hypothetical protein HZC32_02290, partial [Candidatus Woesearchaeota archaeon]|nr:hypothetical protein [Candidatus Woesearchaeota archaeon]